MKWLRMVVIWTLMLALASIALCQGDSTGILSPKVVAGVAKYNTDLSRAEKTYNDSINKATSDLLVILKQAKSDVTKTGDLDQANKIDAKIKSLEATKLEIVGKMRPEKVVKIEKEDPVVNMLTGSWDARFVSGFRSVWTFNRDGTMLSTQGAHNGIWRKTGDGILIVYQWDIIKLPLDINGTVFDSWYDGKNAGSVQKMK
jgi:hypothetical protein